MLPTDPSAERRTSGAARWAASIFERPFARFVVVGAANTLFSFVVFRLALTALHQRPGAPAIAQAGAYAAGVVTGFVAHRSLTFRHDGAVARQLPRFVTVHACMLTLTSGAIQLLVARGGMRAGLAWLLTTVLATMGSFVLQRVFVFSA